jgi:hypothetical protein
MNCGISKITFFVCMILGAYLPARAAPILDPMVELSFQGRKVEGSPLIWDDNTIYLLGRDGRLWDINPNLVTNYKQTAGHFRCFSPSEIRAELLGELGNDYEVSGTSHYLVAHANGQKDKWSEHFEQLYRSFVSYFSLRGFKCSQPPFPLIGVVCRNNRDFMRYSTKNGMPSPGEVLGYYDLESNHILLYDMGGSANSQDWQDNASVVIHEATHQTAFNTGVHNRYCQPPLWLIEGLATMFEAPGVYDSHLYPQLQSRINRGRLSEFRKLVEPRHRPELIQSIIASDKIFDVNQSAAYAEAWALTFYLAENEPRKYAQYMALTASKPPFSQYDSRQRTADFIQVFGANWRMLEAQFLRFMKTLK